MRSLWPITVAVALSGALPARAINDGVQLQPVVTQTVFGAAVGVGNTLMEHNGTANFAVRAGGSQATIPLSRMAPDATVARAFLFWAGTFDPALGVQLDRNVDLTLPNGSFFNNLSVDMNLPGEPNNGGLNRCVQRNHNVGGATTPMFVCRREVTFLLNQLGPGGALGTYTVDDVNLFATNCNNDPTRCQAFFGGWAIVVLWESPTEPVRRDLVLYDAFFFLDEQGVAGPGGQFSSGVGPSMLVDGFTIGPTADGDLTFMAFEGDAQLGVPPQNLAENDIPCNDAIGQDPNTTRRCADWIEVRTNGNASPIRLSDAANRAGNLLNGSNNQGGGPHPGLDIDTFDIGPSGLNVLRAGDTQLFLQAGSGDGIADDGSGGSGELFILSWTLLSVETFSPRFVNAGTEKVVLEPVAGAGETLNYILRLENDGSAPASNTVIRDQLPAGVTYVANSTTNTCGVSSADVGGTSPVLAAGGLNVGTMTVGERCEIRFRVVVNDDVNDGTVLENFFTVEAEAFPALLIGPATTVIQAAEIGTPTKTVAVVGGGAPSQGSTLNYTITIRNTGNRSAPSVSVVDTIPQELENLQLVTFPAGATNASNATTVDIRDITIAPNSSVQVVFSARIRADVSTGTVIANQGRVDQPSLPAPLLTDDPATAATPDSTNVTVASGVSLLGSSKTATDVNGGRVQPGDVIEFRVRVNKSGPAATVISLEDDLPANVTSCQIVSTPPAGFANCGGGGANGTGRVTGAVAMAAPATVDFVFRVTIAANAPDGFVINNTARLTPDVDPAQAVNVSSAPLTVFARPEFVTSTKAVADVNAGDARPNDVLRYTITVTNSGSIAAANTIVTDVVPSSLTVVLINNGGTQSGQTITWNVGALGVNASTTLSFDARINAGTPDGSVISNSATISANAPAQPFTTPAANITVRATPTLAVTKTVADLNAAPFRPGDTVRYSIVVRNNGDGAATSVVVRDAIDPSFEIAILNNGGRVEGADVVFDSTTNAALASIAPGAQVTLTFDARLEAVLVNGTVVSNQARVTAQQVNVAVLSDDPGTAAANDPTNFTVTSQAVLAMTKTFVDDNGGATLPGDTVTFTLTVSNTGDAPATSTSVVDPLDSRFTFVSSPDGGTFAGGSVTFPTATIVPGVPRVLRFTVRVQSPLANGTAIDNQANATSPAAASTVSDDPRTATPLDPTRVIVESRPVFDTMTKTVTDLDGDNVFEPGDRVRYTIVVQNTGSESAVNVVVTDPLPAQLRNIIVGQGGALAGNTATWSVGALAVNASVTLTVEADITRPLADATVVNNQASVIANGVAATPSDDPTTAALDDPTRFTVVSKPRLAVEKTVVDDNGGVVEPGDLLRYTIRLSSSGGRDAQNVTLSDPIDANLINVVPFDGGTLAGNTITWNIASIPIDTTAIVRFDARVRSPLANGTVILNQGSAAFAEPGVPGAPFLSDDPATATPNDPTRVQVVSAADLSVTTLETFNEAGAVIAQARPNQLVRYAIVVQNRGTAVANDATVSLPIPADVTFVSAPGGSFAGGSVTFNRNGVPALAAVAPGDQVPLVVEVRLNTPLDDGRVIIAQASISETGSVSPFVSDDPSTGAFGDPTALEVDSAPDLTGFTKVLVDENGAPVEPNDVVAYVLRVENTGDAIARNTLMSDALPAQVELVDAGGGVVTGNTVTFTLGDVAPGNVVTRTIRVRVRGNLAPGTLVSNQAQVAANGVAGVLSDDPTTAPVDDPTVFSVQTVPRLRVEKDASGGRVHAPDDVITYTITIASVGTAPVLPSVLTDVIDASLVDVTPGAGLAFNPGTRTMSGAVPPLAPGNNATFTYSARVASGAVNGTQIRNQARVTGADVGDVLSDDPATAPLGDATIITIDARPDLANTTKVATDLNGGVLSPGDDVRYLITIENTGAGAARDVRVTDVVDENMTIVSVENGGTSAGNTIVWAAGDVARGGTIALAFVARVDADTADGTAIDNQASLVSLDIEGTVLSDDPATAPLDDPTRVVVRAPTLVVTKRFVDLKGGELGPNDAIEYIIVLRNEGSVAATEIVIRDVVPNDLRDVNVLDGGTLTDGIATWNIAALAPDATATVRLRARVNPLAVGGTVISNRAEVTAREVGLPVVSDDPDTATPNDPTTRVVVANELYVGTVELFDGDSGEPIAGFVVPQQRVRARITFRNQGNQVGRGVVLRVPFQRELFAVDEATLNGVLNDGDVVWDASANEAFIEMPQGEQIVVELEGAIASPIADNLEIPVAGLVTSISSPAPTTIGPAIMRTRSVADLSATTKEVFDDDGGLVEPGDVLTYRITVLNDGGATARNVRVVDAIPGGTIYQASSTRLRAAPVADVSGAPPTQAGLAIGDLEAGRAVVIELKVRVAPSAPRGLRIDNQALLFADGLASAVSDNPFTPLVIGDPTPVIVGGGSSLVAQKVASVASANVGDTIQYAIHVENVGTEPAAQVVVEDAVPSGTRYVPGSLRVDGAGATDAADRDEGQIVGSAIAFRRDLLESGEGVTFVFSVVVESGSVITNQAAVTSTDETLLTDSDPGVPGDQPTVVPVGDARAIVLDTNTVTMNDNNGGALNAGEVVTVRARLVNRSIEEAVVDRVTLTMSNLLAVDAASVPAPLVIDGAAVALGAGNTVTIAPGEAFDIVFSARVSADARTGDDVNVVATASARSSDQALRSDVDLGRASLTVGLLPGTAALSGTLFLDGGDHDGVLTTINEDNGAPRDERVRGLQVLAFWRDDREPVQTAVADEAGNYRLLPIPAGRYRIELRSPGGASFGSVAQDRLEDGEVRELNIPVVATGAVYTTGTFKAAERARVFLLIDDGDNDPGDDRLADESDLAPGQQGQVVTAQGLYRFDPRPGRYRISVEPPDPLTAFPSAAIPFTPDPRGDPQGALASPDAEGDVSELALPDGNDSPYFLRFDVEDGAPPLQRNHLPVDTLKSQLAVTKTANRKRASVGDIVSYSVRIENRALDGVSLREGGVEIVDALPFGFQMLPGSYRLDRISRDAKGQETRVGVAGVRDSGGRVRTFGPFALDPQTTYELRYNVTVGPGVAFGDHENRAAMRLADGQVPITDDALARVQVVPDPVFDLGTVRAKVFCDSDGDGWQDENEEGLPGVRLYADHGHYIDTDVFGKAHFSAIPPGMHLVKIDERTLPHGTTVTSPRASFYASAGLPAQIAFGAKCAFAVIDAPEVSINEAAYKPDGEVGTRRFRVAWQPTPTRVLVDGTALDLPRVDLGLSAEGAEPSFAGAGPNLRGFVDGALQPRIVFTPRTENGVPLAWELVLESLSPAPSPVPGLAPGEGPGASPGTGGLAVWVFAGRGGVPDRIPFDGRDPHTGERILVDGLMYRATLTVGFASGDRVSAPPRVFGVRVGATTTASNESPVHAEIDESQGALFTKAGKPTPKLTAWLGGHVAALKEGDGKIVVVVHSDPLPTAASLTAQRAAAVVKTLAGFGIAAERMEPRGAGDAVPKVPNLRKKDRPKNRRVELTVERPPVETLPPLAAPKDVAPKLVIGKHTLDEDNKALEIDIPIGGAMAFNVVSSTGAVTKVLRGVDKDGLVVGGSDGPRAPVGVEFAPGNATLSVAGHPVNTALLGLRLSTLETTADGSARVVADGPTKLQIEVPSGVHDVAHWMIRVIAERNDAPAHAESDAQVGDVVRELDGEGAPPKEIAWDGASTAGEPVVADGRRFRFRLIVKTAAGDVGIAPELRGLVGAPMSPPSVGAGERLEDPFDANGKLTKAATAQLKTIAADAIARGATGVRIEVHTDDSGKRMERHARTQGVAEAMKQVLVAGGVPADKVVAVGRGSDDPLVPNMNKKSRAQNRRAEIAIEVAAAHAPDLVDTRFQVPASLHANGRAITAREDGTLAGDAPAMTSGEVVLDVRDPHGARASLRVRPGGGELWQGAPAAYAAYSAATVQVPTAETPKEESADDKSWMPSSTPAADLRLELPADLGHLSSDRLLVRGKTSPENRLTIGGVPVEVDPLTGRFTHLAQLKDGDGELLVEVTDPMGNVGRVKRPLHVDTTGWFMLGLADTAFGGSGAQLDELNPYTSLSLGPVFLYGRGAGFVNGRFKGTTVFRDYDLTLHVDTRRWQNDLWAPDLLDPERFYPIYGDSAVENADAARSAFPIYLDLKADASSARVGSIRTDFQGADLFRYQRARQGLQLTFDRGWLTPIDVDPKSTTPLTPPDADPWRTTATTFVAGGGGQRHARVELLGTGSSMYFLRHERVVEGSERVSIIVRDGVTGSEIARTPKVRNVDYTVRYAEGRVAFKEPIGAFADGAFISNHNLGQVASGHRVFVEVEYEHQDDDPFMGLAGGAHVKQRVLGHAEVGGGYIYEAREGGELGYQLGGGHLRLYADEGTWIQGELLGSQSVDAGNFVSFDGGLSYSALGQSLDAKDGRIGGRVFPRDRSGVALKLDGQAQLGAYVGRKSMSDLLVKGYVQQLQPGFFAGASIVEQGQTKWGLETGYQVLDNGKLKLRYDGVISEIPEVAPLTEFRTLHREIATLRYEHRVVAPLTLSGEYGYGYTHDSGAFGQSTIAQPREFHTNVAALGMDWQFLERLAVAIKQEFLLSGDPNQLVGPLDHLVTHVMLKYALTDEVSLLGGTSARWSGENQANLGISWQINKESKIYATERFGLLPAFGARGLGWSMTSVVGGETQLAPSSSGLDSKAYAEYQLDGGISGDQSRAVLGLKNAWKLPYGFMLSFGYERILTLGGIVPTTESGAIPPGAFTDGAFYAAPGANGGGSFVYGEGSRDAISTGVEFKRGELIVASQRFELRYDNLTESRGGHDRLWLLSGTAAAVRLTPELSLLARYNVALAHDLAISIREAYFEDGVFGVAFRPVTHDWVSVLGKLSRRVDVRPLSLEFGSVDDYTVHAASIEPIVETPWKVQLVEKLAIKHASQVIDDVPRADAVTGLWINRVNWHAFSTLRGLGIDPMIPGELDLGVEYRFLAGFSVGSVEHGPLVELQLAPIEFFRFGVGYNFTRFSDDELDRGDIDRSGFFIRAVGQW